MLAAIRLSHRSGDFLRAGDERQAQVGLGVSSVEWLRENGGNSLASAIENRYYSLEAPEKGGPALTSLPQVGVTSRQNTVRSLMP